MRHNNLGAKWLYELTYVLNKPAYFVLKCKVWRFRTSQQYEEFIWEDNIECTLNVQTATVIKMKTSKDNFLNPIIKTIYGQLVYFAF